MSNETTTICCDSDAGVVIEQAVTRIVGSGYRPENVPMAGQWSTSAGGTFTRRRGKLAAVRAWLVEQIGGAYKAGVESVAQTKADGAARRPTGPDALAKAREEGAGRSLRPT